MKKEKIEILERQGCFSPDWTLVDIDPEADLSRIRNVFFNGRVSVGKGTEIINVPGGLANVRIGDNVRIVNVARIENSSDATYGVGTEVAVLDETGGRPVKIYPGISSQVATIAARMPEYAGQTLTQMIDRHISKSPDMPEIGDGAEIIDCGPILDVRIWPHVTLEGAVWLKNGSIVNNIAYKKGIAYVGAGVNAENFIIEDATVANGVLLRNTYVGQGSVLDKGFTSHDSLFFANCSMENGEACAVLAGPYTVSMHKSTLLIGVQTSFMNAGSGTNMSNHMYKLGPVHWGVLERGVKSASNAYMMHGSHIGAFSLVMGENKTHPDTSDFPFSYVFGDAKGGTTVVPGAMLKSYGLKRDAEKWPKRDRRAIEGLKKTDRINFHTFNPHTMSQAIKAVDIIDGLLSESDHNTEQLTYKGMTINRRSLEKGRKLYEMALSKYVQLHDSPATEGSGRYEEGQKWIDLGGQIISSIQFQRVLEANDIEELEKRLDAAEADLYHIEAVWIKEHLINGGDKAEDITKKSEEFDALVESDRLASIRQVAGETDLLGRLL